MFEIIVFGILEEIVYSGFLSFGVRKIYFLWFMFLYFLNFKLRVCIIDLKIVFF